MLNKWIDFHLNIGNFPIQQVHILAIESVKFANGGDLGKWVRK